MQYYRNWIGVFTAKELLDLDMEIVSYEDIIIDYESVVKNISKFINQDVSKIKDVRKRKNKKIEIYIKQFPQRHYRKLENNNRRQESL